MAHIGTLNEGSLHAELKRLEARPGDRFEVEQDGFVIDIVRDGELIEIQTGPAAAMRRKLDALLDIHPMRIVHPIPAVVYLHAPDRPPRRSPVRSSLYAVFEWLVSVPTLVDHPHFSLDAILIAEDRIREHDPSLRRRRGGWRTVDRRLRDVLDRRLFTSVADLAALLPDELTGEFTTADLAAAAGIRRRLAQQMAYCLRAGGAISETGRSKAGITYRT